MSHPPLFLTYPNPPYFLFVPFYTHYALILFTLIKFDSILIVLLITRSTQRVKNSENAAPNLLTQIVAYQQNYFHVEELIEDSKTKAAALDTVASMEAKMKEVNAPHQF